MLTELYDQWNSRKSPGAHGRLIISIICMHLACFRVFQDQFKANLIIISSLDSHPRSIIQTITNVIDNRAAAARRAAAPSHGPGPDADPGPGPDPDPGTCSGTLILGSEVNASWIKGDCTRLNSTRVYWPYRGRDVKRMGACFYNCYYYEYYQWYSENRENKMITKSNMHNTAQKIEELIWEYKEKLQRN